GGVQTQRRWCPRSPERRPPSVRKQGESPGVLEGPVVTEASEDHHAIAPRIEDRDRAGATRGSRVDAERGPSRSVGKGEHVHVALVVAGLRSPEQNNAVASHIVDGGELLAAKRIIRELAPLRLACQIERPTLLPIMAAKDEHAPSNRVVHGRGANGGIW